MTKHTPSTADIRIRYERYREQEHQRGADGVTPVTPGEFDRWHADELAAAESRGAERGWDEAAAIDAGCHDCIALNGETNPYRTERDHR